MVKVVISEDIIKMADFMLYDFTFYQQISGNAIGTKFAPSHAYLFMDTKLLKTQDIKPWLWKRFIDDIIFIWADSKDNLSKFLEDLKKFHRHFKFACEKSKENITFHI